MNEARQFLEMMATVAGHRHKFSKLLQLGECGQVTEFNVDERKLIHTVRKLADPEPKECYANAQKALMRYFPEDQFSYVEGYVSIPKTGLSVEHAWLKLNGKVMDLTLPTDGDYFGIDIPREVVIAYCLEGEMHGPLLDDYQLGYKYAAKVLGMESLLRAKNASKSAENAQQ